MRVGTQGGAHVDVIDPSGADVRRGGRRHGRGAGAAAGVSVDRRRCRRHVHINSACGNPTAALRLAAGPRSDTKPCLPRIVFSAPPAGPDPAGDSSDWVSQPTTLH